MAIISIIIPVYNVESYLQRCLDSVSRQTFQDTEIICINNCSTDDCGKMLAQYAEKDSRVRVINNAVNLGVGMSRNIGLQAADGEFVYFMDSDDYIESGYLQQLYDNAIKHNADITMNTSVWVEEDGKKHQYIHRPMPAIPEDGCYMDSVAASEKTYCVVWTRLFRRELLISNQIQFEKINYAEDIVFNYAANIYAKSFFVFPGSSFYHYYRRENSLSYDAEKKKQEDYRAMVAYDHFFDYLAGHDLLQENKVKLFHVHPFFQVNTPEKYDLYKSYFMKTIHSIEEHREQYNDLELFFAHIILSSVSFFDYQEKYPDSVTIAYLKNKR